MHTSNVNIQDVHKTMPSQNKVITTSKPKVNITLHPCFWNADRKKHSPKCGVTKMDISRLKKKKSIMQTLTVQKYSVSPTWQPTKRHEHMHV